MRRPTLRGYITGEYSTYIQLLVENEGPFYKKRGLQLLCRLYRRGYALRRPHAIRQALTGLLHNRDAKVKRWAFNAIALLGVEQDHLVAVTDAIRRERADPDLLGAGVAALIGLVGPDRLDTVAASLDIPIEGEALLAAAQFSSEHGHRLSINPIRVDTATLAQLRLSAVLAGLGRAPEHLFHSNFENSVVLAELNRHHDIIVAQYSIWAMCENRSYGFKCLGVNIRDLSIFPSNVQGWIVQLVGADKDAAKAHLDIIEQISLHEPPSVREGLIIGLRENYFDGLEGLTLEWLVQEPEDSVRHALLEHMSLNANQCVMYADRVRIDYEAAPVGSLLRARLEAAARDTTLLGDLKRIAIRSHSPSLFGEAELYSGRAPTMVQNFYGSVGNVAGRDVNNQGDVNVGDSKNAEKLASLLERLEVELAKYARSDSFFMEGKALVAEAKSDQSPSRVQRVKQWIREAVDTGKLVVTGVDTAEKIAKEVIDFTDKLPLR